MSPICDPSVGYLAHAEPLGGHTHTCPQCGIEWRHYYAIACVESHEAACGNCQMRVLSLIGWPSTLITSREPAGPVCLACRGTGRRSSPDVTLGYDWPCWACTPASAARLAELQAAAEAAGLEAAALRTMTEAIVGTVPTRLRERDVTTLLAAIDALTTIMP